MYIDFLLEIFEKNATNDSIIYKDKTRKYKWLSDHVTKLRNDRILSKINNGSVIALKGDFNPHSIALLLNLIEKSCIVVPLTENSIKVDDELLDIAQVEMLLTIDEQFVVKGVERNPKSDNKYYRTLRERNHPGLVLFTSGTSGEPKAAVHDFLALLKKFKIKRRSLRTLNFLLFDHWGGLNTLFHILSSGGVVISTKNRRPEQICELIDKHQIELLPTSPTFLNLLILSEAYKNYNLSSLKIISYGTEPMPENTLMRVKSIFPEVKLLQTYGLIELGVLRSKSEKDDSLWVKVGGDGYKTRIIDDILQIKADSAMLGYLNAPSPFTEDGWFITGDRVLKKGEFIKILGRDSEIINVGGEKVYPQEVENVILNLDNVAEVTVYREKNLIMGNIVGAKIRLIKNEDKKLFINRLKQYCKGKLDPYKIPIKITILDKGQYSQRFKKVRS